MRRFELVEGTSSKFWQIALDGSAFTVTWGRMGTNGQTQTKSFDSADKARKEHDKLVAEKVKKGYSEVEPSAVDTARAPVAAKPKPDPEQTAVEQPSVVWSSGPLKEASPVRGLFPKPPARDNPVSLRSAVRDAASPYVGAIESQLGRAGAARDAMQAALRVAASPELPMDPRGQAALFVLFGPTRGWNDPDLCETIMRLWLAEAGLDFAMRALAEAGAFTRKMDSKRAEGLQLWLEPVASAELSSGGYKAHHAWRPLREWIAALDDAAFREAHATAAELRGTAPLWVRSTLSAALADPDWVLQDADEWLQEPRQRLWMLWPLVASVADPADASRLIEKAKAHVGAHVWSLLHGMADVRADLVARLGVRAAGPLLDLLRISLDSGQGGDIIRDTGEVLAMIRSPEVATSFAKLLERKELRAVASTHLHGSPRFGLAALAEVASTRGGAADLARALLAPLVASHADLADEVAASLPEAAREAIRRARARGGPVEEAEASELPAVLREPPWTRSRPRTATRELRLDPMDVPEHIDWASGQRAEWDTKATWAQPSPQNEAQIVASIERSQTAERAGWQGAACTLILQLSEKNALHVMQTARFDRLHWYFKVAPVLLARYELRALPGVLRYAEFDPVGAIEALEPVASTRIAPVMADALARLKKGRPMAKAWLERFPEHAASGLIPPAVGPAGKSREAAGAALRHLASRGHEGVVRDVARRYGREAEGIVGEVLAYDPLFELPARLPKLPSFWQPAGLPRPRLAGSGKALPLAALDALGTMLAFSRPDDPYPGLVQLKEASDARSLAEFAWELFQAWLLAGAPSKEGWAFTALGVFGDDECARKLTALVRQWPGEGGHARAVTGLEVLARIGTDVALMHLHGIAQKVAFKGLQAKAREKIDEIAEARGLTADELADRLVPDLGLDDDGSLTLDFGARAFRVGFDESLKPYVLDAAGKRIADLPKPGKTDDAEKAKPAVETWKALKKDARTIAHNQILRLELAMCAQRRWERDVFQRFLLEHPLMVHLVRRLVWGVYRADDRLMSTFRVAEDRTLADENDGAYVLPDDARVGVPHRLELGDALVARWGQVLGDYEIIQPFPQLSRETFTPSADERVATELAVVKGLKVPTGKVLGLDARGWRRGPPQDAGVVCWYEKPLGDGKAVHLDLSGIYTGAIADSPEQELGTVVIQTEGTWGKDGQIVFAEMPPVAYSELLRDLNSLRA